MRSGDFLRAWLARSVQSAKGMARRSHRYAVQQRIANAVRCGVEPLEKRTMLAATPLYWDPSGAATASGGSGTWDTSTAEWRSGSPTGSLVAWSNSGDSNGPCEAVFPTGDGTVTLGASVSAANVFFVAANTTLVGGSGSDVLTLAGGQIDVASGSTGTISAAIAAGSGITKTSAGTLNLTGTVTGTAAELDVQQGSLTISGGESWQTVEVETPGTLIVQESSAQLIVSGGVTADGLLDHMAGAIQTPVLTIDSTGVFSDQGGSVSGSVGSLIINNAGVFDSNTDQSLQGSSGSFNNSGFYEVDNSGGSSTTTLSMSFTQGNGTIDVTAGTLSIPNAISFDTSATLTFMGAGTLSIPNLDDDAARIVQDSGTISVTNQVSVGDQYGNGAQYNLVGGTLGTNYLSIGCFSTAAFTQSGGTLSAGHTEIGSYGTGAFTQTAGTSSFYDMYLGGYGNGAMNLSGGTTTAFTIADGRDGIGVINLSGSASLTATGGETVGDEGGTG